MRLARRWTADPNRTDRARRATGQLFGGISREREQRRRQCASGILSVRLVCSAHFEKSSYPSFSFTDRRPVSSTSCKKYNIIVFRIPRSLCARVCRTISPVRFGYAENTIRFVHINRFAVRDHVHGHGFTCDSLES